MVLSSRSFLVTRGVIMVKKVYYGGQAVIEGVMMRGRKVIVTVVRRPDGELAVDKKPLPTI